MDPFLVSFLLILELLALHLLLLLRLMMMMMMMNLQYNNHEYFYSFIYDLNPLYHRQQFVFFLMYLILLRLFCIDDDGLFCLLLCIIHLGFYLSLFL
jgi:hypothetical protein